MRAYRLLSGFIALGCSFMSYIVACAFGVIESFGGGDLNGAIFGAPLLMALTGIVSVLMCWNKNFIVSIFIIILFMCAGIVELCAIKDFSQAWIFASIMILLALGHIGLTIYEKRNKRLNESESN